MGWVGALLSTPAGGVETVSIPERVWGGLEQPIEVATQELGPVSIPERVWGGLEPVGFIIQSSKKQVSIPERVWGGLEP